MIFRGQALELPADAVRLSSPDCVKVLDGEGRVQTFNADGLRLMELDDLAAVAGRYWPSLWPDEMRPLAECALSGARTSGVATFLGECPTARGTPKWWEVTVAAVPGPAPQFCVISRDVTERVTREADAEAEEERVHMALAASGSVGLWDWMVDTNRLHGGENFARLYGLDIEKTAAGLTEAEYQEFVVPEDLPALRAQIRAVFDRGADFLAEYRLAVPGQPIRWVECKGKLIKADGDGRDRFSGTAVDITHRKQAEAQKQLLMQELAHRVKNTFMLVQATAAQTLRGLDPIRLETFQARLSALARAHDLLLQADWAPTPVADLVARVLQLEHNRARFETLGADIRVNAEAALSLSLLLHELMTNATKYGALSADRGKVEVAWGVDADAFWLTWIERGGPPASPPQSRGFGARLLAMGVCGSRQAELRYAPTGLDARFSAPLSRVVEIPD